MLPALVVPYLLGGSSLGLALTGLAKLVKATQNLTEAGRIRHEADQSLKNVAAEMEQARQRVAEQVADLGRMRLAVASTSLVRLVDLVRQVHQAEVSDVGGENAQVRLDRLPLEDMEQLSYEASQFLLHLGQGTSAGALLGWGLGQGVVWAGQASTGAAISGLSGAAATNATLAWLGGGSLASGGFGMAGGSVVLGMVFTGPLIFVLGYGAAGHSEKALTQAHAHSARIDEAIEQAGDVGLMLQAVSHRVVEFASVLEKLDAAFNTCASRVARLLGRHRRQLEDGAGAEVASRIPYGALNPQEQLAYQTLLVLGGQLNAVVRMRLLDDSGGLEPGVDEHLKALKQRMEAFS